MKKKKGATPTPIRVGPEHLGDDPAPLPELGEGHVYELPLESLIREPGAEIAGPLRGNDLILLQKAPKEKDGSRKKKKKKKKICPCVVIWILADVPREAWMSRPRSKLGNGGWRRKAGREFRKALRSVKTIYDGCLDDICFYIYDDINMNHPPCRPLFGTTEAGKPNGMLNLNKLDDVMDVIRRTYPKRHTDKCMNLVLYRYHYVPGSIFTSIPGTTPIDVDAQTGKATGKGFSFLLDAAGAVPIAHELGHQAGITHAKDNRIHRNANGDLDGGTVPANQKRKAKDLFAPKPPKKASDVTLRKEDCAKLKAHVQSLGCCQYKDCGD